MPRWARFLSCSFTGLILSVAGFLMAAHWQEGGVRFWSRLLDFMATRAFWSMIWLFALLVGATLLSARVAVNLYGLSGTVSGFLAGGLVALAYATFLVASHAGDWGGMAAAMTRAWPAAGAFSLPFAVAGAMITWLWDRLD